MADTMPRELMACIEFLWLIGEELVVSRGASGGEEVAYPRDVSLGWREGGCSSFQIPYWVTEDRCCHGDARRSPGLVFQEP